MPQNGIHLDGSKVRRHREAMLQSQEDFARGCDLHPNTLVRIESDAEYRTSFKTARKIATRFGLDATELLREPEEAVS